MERPWFDTLLLLYVVAFFLFEAILLNREGQLGWAMTAKCLALATTFTFALLVTPATSPDVRLWGAVVVRVFLATALTWAVVALLRERRRSIT